MNATEITVNCEITKVDLQSVAMGTQPGCGAVRCPLQAGDSSAGQPVQSSTLSTCMAVLWRPLPPRLQRGLAAYVAPFDHVAVVVVVGLGLGLGLVVGLHLDLDVGDGARGQPPAQHRGRRRAGDLQMQGYAEERQAVIIIMCAPYSMTYRSGHKTTRKIHE